MNSSVFFPWDSMLIHNLIFGANTFFDECNSKRYMYNLFLTNFINI